MADEKIVKRWLVGGIIAGLFVLTFLLLRPILIPIVFGILFAYIFNPIFKFLNKYIKPRNLAALILIIGIISIIAIPIVNLAPSLVRQSADVLNVIQNFDFEAVLNNFLDPDIASAFEINFDNVVSNLFVKFMSQFQKLLLELPTLVLQFAVFLFTFFFVIRDTDELKRYVSSLSPFSKATEAKFLKELRGITNAIVFGQVFIGIIQGLAVGVGLFFLGVPNALLLTFLASAISIIPFLGSWLVWLPVSLFLMATEQTFQGIFLFLYGILFVASIDNIARPYILSKRSNLPMALSVIGTIGGLFLFGIAGLVLGPLIFAYVLIIIEFYQQGKLDELFKK